MSIISTHSLSFYLTGPVNCSCFTITRGVPPALKSHLYTVIQLYILDINDIERLSVHFPLQSRPKRLYFHPNMSAPTSENKTIGINLFH
jgi:hypothetical protein